MSSGGPNVPPAGLIITAIPADGSGGSVAPPPQAMATSPPRSMATTGTYEFVVATAKVRSGPKLPPAGRSEYSIFGAVQGSLHAIHVATALPARSIATLGLPRASSLEFSAIPDPNAFPACRTAA